MIEMVKSPTRGELVGLVRLGLCLCASAVSRLLLKRDHTRYDSGVTGGVGLS